jgi:uncharacterized protein (TIGR02001 family)
MFKKSLATTFATVAFAATAYAQTPAAPASPHTFSANIGVFSQYIFRGLTQTNGKPALQGGLDYSHSSGLYIGTWMTNISWLRENFPATTQYQSGGRMEIDVYGGYKANFGKSDFTYDIGLLQYIYPGSPKPTVGPVVCTYGTVACPKADTLEFYGAIGWKWITLKYSHGLDTKTFGVPNSRGTNYIDLTADVPVGETGFTVNLHYGKQTFKGQNPTILSNNTLYSYSDWKAGVSYALPKDFTIGAYATGTSGASNLGYGSVAQGGAYPNNIAKTTGTVFIKKTF